MEERAIATGTTRLLLACGTRRYPILSLGQDGCLIDAPGGSTLRGFADILDGERLVATCLIVLAAPDGPHLRCSFKRCTAPRSASPADYVTS